MSAKKQNQSKYIDFEKAAQYCRATYGTNTNRTTVWRWATEGKCGVRLETRRVGMQHYRTTTAWLDEYFARLAEMARKTSHV